MVFFRKKDRAEALRPAKYLLVEPVEQGQYLYTNLVTNKAIFINQLQHSLVQKLNSKEPQKTTRLMEEFDIGRDDLCKDIDFLEKNDILLDKSSRKGHFPEKMLIVSLGSMEDEGLGGFIKNITKEAYCILRNCELIVCYRSDWYVEQVLKKINPNILSLLPIWWQFSDKSLACAQMAEKYLEVISSNKDTDIVLVTEGNASIGELPVSIAISKAKEAGMKYRIVQGLSSLDNIFNVSNFDPYLYNNHALIIRPGNLDVIKDCKTTLVLVCFGYSNFTDKIEYSNDYLTNIEKELECTRLILLKFFPKDHICRLVSPKEVKEAKLEDMTSFKKYWVGKQTTIIIPGIR
jgi:hypothetical protein